MDQFFTVLEVHDYRVCNIYKCDSHTSTIIIIKEKNEERKTHRQKERRKENKRK